MKYPLDILQKELSRQNSINNHYKPSAKEGNTINAREMYSDSNNKIKQLEKAITLIKASGQSKMF